MNHEGDHMNQQFWVRQSGNIGQEILDSNGQIIVWTTDGWTAQVIARLLNENEDLLRPVKK